jgi:sigma-B regulation protein RsbU (phosphoserine phosphatase)
MPDREPVGTKEGRRGILSDLIPTTIMGQLMLIGIVVWFVDWVFSGERELFGSSALKTLFDVLSFLALIPCLYFLARGISWIIRNLLWRLRRRLILTYFLIGFLPLALLVLLAAIGGYAVLWQSSSELVSRQLEGYLEQSRAATSAIALDLSRLKSESSEANLTTQLQERADALAPVFPGVMIQVRQEGRAQQLAVGRSREAEPGNAASRRSNLTEVESRPLPPWFKGRDQFNGLIVQMVGPAETQVFARHVVRLQGSSTIVQLSYPIGTELAAHISHTTGLAVKPGTGTAESIEADTSGDTRVTRTDSRRGFNLALAGYPIILSMTDWQTGRERTSDALTVDLFELTPRQILTRLTDLRTRDFLGAIFFNAVTGLAVIFLGIALLAVISAFFLTRSITGAVHNLYQGTKRVEAGDLEHQIPIRGHDQLSALTNSFNQMTRSVRDLLRVSAEKERLDQEMRIAAQVQAQLFPRHLPEVASLDIGPGVYIPARSVSGDYYDLLEISPGVIGIAVADVCGKGMSAALLMSNLQANLRSQVRAFHDAYGMAYRYAVSTAAKAALASDSPDNGSIQGIEGAVESEFPRKHPVQQIVDRVNRQIVTSTIDATFITLFYAEFDEAASTLTYTNAGHNPPLLLRRDTGPEPKIERLESGGTVLGLFHDAEYEDVEVSVSSGDVLVAFTDGLIEAQNHEGVEFGEDRLALLVGDNSHLAAAELERTILHAVKAWTGDSEQEDDLTLVVVRIK